MKKDHKTNPIRLAEAIQEADDFINKSVTGDWISIDDAEKLWIQGIDIIYNKK